MDMSHRASFGAALLLFSNVVSAGEILVSRLGSPFATVMAPGGQGSRDINVIRDGKKPATLSGVGRELAQLQYDTWDGTTPASKEWIGYQFASLQSFTRVVFQEGRHFPDGGFFDPPKSLVVQVRSAGGGWERAPGTWNPRYTGLLTGKAAISFETFTWIIDPPMLGDAIRIYGTPGGSADFISCAELEVYALSTAERPDVTMIEMADGSRFLGSFAAKELIVRTRSSAPSRSPWSGSRRWSSDRRRRPAARAMERENARRTRWRLER